MAAGDYFSIPIFFIIFRETTEAAVIVSVLLSFLNQVLVDDPVMRKRLGRQVWAGMLLGLAISLGIGAAFIVVWNKYAKNLWASSEGIWVGIFSMLAVVMITVMGIAMLRTEQMQEKWKVKLSKSMDEEAENSIANKSRRYALFILPLITVLREGLEAVVFIGGITFTESPQAIPAAVVAGALLGALLGFLLYKGGNRMRLHPFFVGSTCLLLLLAAGLVAKGVASFESYVWNQLIGAKSDDAGFYDPRVNVWALSCCNPKDPNAGFWQLFNALFGWSNIASDWTIIFYILYWVVVVCTLMYLKRKHIKAAEAKLMAVLEREEMEAEEEEERAYVQGSENAEDMELERDFGTSTTNSTLDGLANSRGEVENGPVDLLDLEGTGAKKNNLSRSSSRLSTRLPSYNSMGSHRPLKKNGSEEQDN